MVNVPIFICTAQIQARSALCFISLIKSLNFAGLLEYFTVISLIFLSRQLIMVEASRVKLTSSSWIPQHAISASAQALRN
jgi:hypothetical protein